MSPDIPISGVGGGGEAPNAEDGQAAWAPRFADESGCCALFFSGDVFFFLFIIFFFEDTDDEAERAGLFSALPAILLVRDIAATIFPTGPGIRLLTLLIVAFELSRRARLALRCEDEEEVEEEVEEEEEDDDDGDDEEEST
jgi:hypothetical protein